MVVQLNMCTVHPSAFNSADLSCYSYRASMLDKAPRYHRNIIIMLKELCRIAFCCCLNRCNPCHCQFHQLTSASLNLNLTHTTDINTDTNTDTNIDTNTEANIDTNTEANTETNTDTNTETNTDTNTEANVDTNTEANTDTNTEANTDATHCLCQ